MNTIEAIVAFLAGYSTLAKVGIFGGLALSIATLVFAPRTTISKDVAGQDGAAYLKIEEVQLFPPQPEWEVRVFAFVNGTKFVHPSVGGVEWMKVGPGMSEKTIPLPSDEEYDLRFELIVRDPAGGDDNKRSASQEIVFAKTLPESGEYRLYSVSPTRTRSASVTASIKYSLFLK